MYRIVEMGAREDVRNCSYFRKENKFESNIQSMEWGQLLKYQIINFLKTHVTSQNTDVEMQNAKYIVLFTFVQYF